MVFKMILISILKIYLDNKLTEVPLFPVQKAKQVLSSFVILKIVDSSEKFSCITTVSFKEKFFHEIHFKTIQFFIQNRFSSTWSKHHSRYFTLLT
jgi:hypothetical protein